MKSKQSPASQNVFYIENSKKEDPHTIAIARDSIVVLPSGAKLATPIKIRDPRGITVQEELGN